MKILDSSPYKLQQEQKSGENVNISTRAHCHLHKSNTCSGIAH